MDDIKIFIQNLFNVSRFEERDAGLMSGQWREKSKSTLETMHPYIWMVIVVPSILPAG
jgi:hypothetical protein